MGFISEKDIIGGFPNISPEAIFAINSLYSTYNNNSAAHRQIINVVPLYYCGAIPGAEFETVAVTKVYLCLSAIFTGYSGAIAIGDFRLWDPSSNIIHRQVNYSVAWDVTGAAFKYAMNKIELSPCHFGCVVRGNTDYMIFYGYRITLN